jgi:hypothetical protein
LSPAAHTKAVQKKKDVGKATSLDRGKKESPARVAEQKAEESPHCLPQVQVEAVDESKLVF